MEKKLNATGRRKGAVARVYLSKGTGKITINDREYTEYFSVDYLQKQVELPMATTETADQYDFVITVKGGGIKGQAEAIKMGIARALCKDNEELHPALKHAGLLTRDARVVERKKFGKAKARKSFQFSKR